MRGLSVAFGVPMLWAAGCLAVPAMAVASSAAVYAITAYACLLPGHDLQDTYFIVLHFHNVIWQAAELVVVLGLFAGCYHFFPQVTGYSYSQRLGRIHFWLSIAGVGALYLMGIIFTVQLCWFGLDAGMLRYWNRVSPTGAYVLAAGLVVFLANMVLSFVRRRPAR